MCVTCGQYLVASHCEKKDIRLNQALLNFVEAARRMVNV